MPCKYKFSGVNPEQLGSYYRKSNSVCILNEEDTANVITTSDTKSLYRALNKNGLMGVMQTAYSNHVPLVLRPDDVWVAISMAFAKYITNNSEAMRNFFVNFEGRKELIVDVRSRINEWQEAEFWKSYTDLLVPKIREQCNPEIVKWFTPEFTTTTEMDKFISNLMLMGALKEYFSYSCCMSCGFSEITLEGEKEDWLFMIDKVKYLEQFNNVNLTEWSQLLTHVLGHFVDMFDGHVDEDFWQRALTSKSRGSGGQSKYKGWFLVFAPFSSTGKYLLNKMTDIFKTNIYGSVNDDSITDCVMEVPVKIDDHGQVHQVKIVLGSWMMQYVDGKLGLVSSMMVIKRPHVTEEKFKEMILEGTKKYNKEYRNKKSIPEPYIRFAYQLATKYLVPQDYFLSISECMVNWLGICLFS